MPVKSFRQFLGAKNLESKRQLDLIQKLLEHGGLKIERFMDDHFQDPYIYCYNPDKDTSFKGIRIYKIGDRIAFRVQRESKTHAFGTAYMLDLDAIFNEFMKDGATKKETLGKKVMQEVIENIKSFFKESAKAEKESDTWNDEDGVGTVHVRQPLGGDYSSDVVNK